MQSGFSLPISVIGKEGKRLVTCQKSLEKLGAPFAFDAAHGKSVRRQFQRVSPLLHTLFIRLYFVILGECERATRRASMKNNLVIFSCRLSTSVANPAWYEMQWLAKRWLNASKRHEGVNVQSPADSGAACLRYALFAVPKIDIGTVKNQTLHLACPVTFNIG